MQVNTIHQQIVDYYSYFFFTFQILSAMPAVPHRVVNVLMFYSKSEHTHL